MKLASNHVVSGPTVTLRTRSPSSFQRPKRKRVAPSPCGEGASSTWEVFAFQASRAGVFTRNPSMTTSSPGGLVVIEVTTGGLP